MLSVCLLSLVAVLGAGPAAERTPEQRALDFLSREVPRWSRENHCFSCHNNGDAARALYTATRLAHPVPDEALAETTRWLSRPESWEKNGGKDAAADKGLARIQFAAAAATALDAGFLKDRKPLVQAAELVAERQEKDGSWKVDAAGTTGSPATYGTCLATCLACRALRRAGRCRFGAALDRADHWLREVRVASVVGAAAVVMALEESDAPDARAQRSRCLKLIREGQGQDGGWGPYVSSSSEVFDTALVVLALVPLKDQADIAPLLRRGRGFLLATQRQDGSWPETTRPAGGDSYAQRLSTAGWATLALLATAP
jgi:hypothetical protein